MGNTLGKTGQRISDQLLSCGNRRKKKLAKLSNGGLQSGGTSSPETESSTPSKANNVASWTKQEEAVSLLSHGTSQAAATAAAAEVGECQKPKEGVDYEKKDEEARIQQYPKMMTATPPPSPFQQEPSLNSKPAQQVLQEQIQEGKKLNNSSVEEDQCVIVKTFDRSNDSHNDKEGNKNSNSSCIGTDVIQEKTKVKNVRQQKLNENVENLDKDGKTVVKLKQDDPLKELENRQDAIFARLHKIQNELDKMSICSESKMTTAGQSSNGPSVKIAYQDVVIGVDPSHVPLSLLVLYKQLSQIFKVKISVFVHSTVKKSPMPHLQSLFKSALPARQPDDCRTTNDLLLTFIYKHVRQDCSLMVNPERQTYIYGEVNVARYLSRLADPDYESDPVTSTQIDHWLDLASLMLWNGNGKAKSQMVQNIDLALTKKKWLVGQNLSLADIVVWSGLHYAKMMDKLPSNVQAWRKNCENHPYFNLVSKVQK